MEETKTKKNGKNGNGDNPQINESVVKEWLKHKDKQEVPHPYNVLFNQETEQELNKTTRVNNRQVVFFAVNKIRDMALRPPISKKNPEGRASISTELRMELKSLFISMNGEGRTDVKEVNTINQEDANMAPGNSAAF